MKRTLFVALLACVTLMFTSCTKEKDLNGTKWTTHTTHTQEMTYMGITAAMNLTIDGTMNFTSTTDGSATFTTSGTVSVPSMGMSQPLDGETSTDKFTYTFDGTNGTLTIADDNSTETVPFAYNKKDNTITISRAIKDDQTGLSFTLTMVFTEVK